MHHTAAYKFVEINEQQLPDLKTELQDYCRNIGLKGTILLSTEGINLFVAGEMAIIEQLQAYLSHHQLYSKLFSDLSYKTSHCETIPYTRMLVKIKKEVITFHDPSIVPHQETAPHLAPETFKQWYEQQKPMVVLDTRNRYEIAFGSFDEAIDLNIDSFHEFPEASQQLDVDKDLPVVTFCTGGIRCEKAAALLMRQGYKNVYQLDGGILNYFNECGDEHYHGECFVFDKRIALDGDLQETRSEQCRHCRQPLTADGYENPAHPTCRGGCTE